MLRVCAYDVSCVYMQVHVCVYGLRCECEYGYDVSAYMGYDVSVHMIMPRTPIPTVSTQEHQRLILIG